MRIVATALLKENTKLAKPICNENGIPLIQSGIPLTRQVIDRLIGLGIAYVYIEDDRTNDIDAKPVISEKTRAESIQLIKREFTKIADEMRLKKRFNGDHLSKDFSKIIADILEEIKSNNDALMMLSDAFLHDSYIFSHSLNVTVYALGLALELKLSDKQILELGLGAILHDVGKMLTPPEILNKPGRLTKEEFEIMKQHTIDGFQMLKDLPNIPLLAAHCALQHHERMNGSGYPRGLKGDEIHLYAQILGICDVFDAVTSHRVYRRAMLPHEGLELLYSGSGTLYNTELIRAFRNIVAIYPDGLEVMLSDGRSGVVVKQNHELSTRPVVRIFKENGMEVKPYDVDLMKTMNVTIVSCEMVLAEPVAIGEK